MKVSVVFTVALALGALCATPAPADIVNVVVGGGFVSDGTFPPNWQTWAVDPLSMRTELNAARDSDGDDWYAILMAGNYATGAYIYQVVSVAAGESYDFKFDACYNGNKRDIRADVFNGDVTGNAGFFSDLTLKGDLYDVTTTTLTTAYQQFGGTIVPTQSLVTIRLYDLAQNTSLAGLWLDNVQLNGPEPGSGPEIPEPATMALLAVGAVGSLLRRRRA
ncbi:MAG: PEP-CTERM sorting domain-containing protein [Planctomycetaceae bacterium]|nr:PEP-CTERM sorting domain-containing protein [Planctomycetaceae bacterium]